MWVPCAAPNCVGRYAWREPDGTLGIVDSSFAGSLCRRLAGRAVLVIGDSTQAFLFDLLRSVLETGKERPCSLRRDFAASECATDSRGGCSPHAPCPDLVGEAVTAYLACCAEAAQAERRNLRIAASVTMALARQISRRYAQWAVLQFGRDDEAVARMLCENPGCD